MESVVLLALAVLLFRTFAAEGYLISTGSMAPTLLGYHRRLECPACHFAFTRGAAFEDDSTLPANIASADFESSLSLDVDSTQCPNCSLAEMNARIAPRNEGDQLLVQKLAYEFRDPHRWEVIVFQNRDDPSQAYVKRVVGLPGESLQIRDGDLYANHHLMRKPFAVQQAVRIPVSDFFHQPEDHDPDWRARWVVDSGSVSSTSSNSVNSTAENRPAGNQYWRANRHSLVFRKDTPFEQYHSAATQGERVNPEQSQLPTQIQTGEQTEIQWVVYENWIRNGGDHETRVPLASWRSEIAPPTDPRFRYEQGELVCLGTFSAFERDQWLQRVEDEELRAALERVYQNSHVAPIVDHYGYNSDSAREHSLQHDLMLSVTFTELTGAGQFEAILTDGAESFRLILFPSRKEMALYQSPRQEPLWISPIQLPDADHPLRLDLSLFDQQVIVALNGVVVRAPVEYTVSSPRPPLLRPARFGAANLQCEITSLMLYRDLHYTSKSPDPFASYQLGSDEFFVLGDNSPVSLDSRVWANPAVERKSLIGKPFIVHLPSRQEEFHWKGKLTHVRVPDFSKIRYIR